MGFYEAPDKWFRYLVNKDCDSVYTGTREYRQVMRTCGGDKLTRPTHYLYNVPIPIRLAPDSLFKAIGKEPVFYLDTLEHHPRVDLDVRCSANVPAKDQYELCDSISNKCADEALAESFRRISARYPVIGTEIQARSSSGGRGKCSQSKTGKIIFAYGTDLAAIPGLGLADSVGISKLIQPKSYTLVFASKSGDIDSAKAEFDREVAGKLAGSGFKIEASGAYTLSKFNLNADSLWGNPKRGSD